MLLDSIDRQIKYMVNDGIDDRILCVFDDIFRVLKRIQASDESVVEMRHECQVMTELCQKVLKMDVMLRPTVIQI